MKKIISLAYCIVVAVTAAGQNKCIIYFDSGKSDLTPASIHKLDSVISILSAVAKIPNDFITVSIDGYCDNTGDTKSNQSLSEARAKRVFDYFGEKKMTVVASKDGHGESSPAADNETEAGKAKNRRVELSYILPRPTSANEATAEILPKPEENKTTGSVKQPEVLTEENSIANLSVGQTLVLKNLNFEGGTAMLLKEATPSLELLLKIMKENPGLEIEIEGHVCCANDMPLSVARAIRVYKYLVAGGIKEERLRYQGHSNFQPLTEERDEDERIMNRRVEIKIMKK
ncbi:MAG: OmpA family protein [Bacteroidia bacterium]|jgi:outer membrane protein OmpA-like peptidoglycan-associated protein